ncbi:WcaI family glycosyltransferase [Xanthobacter autotrophicus DSM 431]|uniref:WcaI family glycosyltransferase n=1 Tax=Xanthobacter nonsaccharivorans TaxID=3119912 RepID=UPI003729937C
MAKILIVAMNYTPELTGCGQYTGDLGAAMREKGHEVEVVTAPPHYPGWQVKAPYRNRYSTEQFKGATIHRCPVLLRQKMGGIWRLIAPVSFALTSAPKTLWRALAWRPEVVLVVEPTLFCAPVALLAAKAAGARSVLHVQDLEVDAAFAVGHLGSAGLLKRLAFAFERACLAGFDRIVTISNRMAERLREKGLSQDKMVVIRNWVDLDHIRPLPRQTDYRTELGLPQDAYVVLYSGNIGPKQGLDVVVEAARILKDDGRIFFAIAGEGPSKAELVTRAEGLPNVRFLPFQPYERLPAFLGTCDLHVLPQLASAGDLVLPSKLGGMLASGRPIIVGAEAGTELAVFLDGAATIVAPEQPQALADGILECLAAGFGPEAQARTAALARKLSRPDAMNELEAAFLSPVTGAAGGDVVPQR